MQIGIPELLQKIGQQTMEIEVLQRQIALLKEEIKKDKGEDK